MKFCHRCSCPVEEPITYADAMLASGTDEQSQSCASRFPVCVHCADVALHRLVD